jgi:ketosteroid isomerase-like protein
MRRLMMVVVAVGIVLAAGASYGQGSGPAMPAKVRAFLGRLIGTWDLEGGPVKGQAVYRWDVGGNYVIGSAQDTILGQPFNDTSLWCWDGLSEDGIVLYSTSSRGHAVDRVRIVSEMVVEGRGTGIEDGKKGSGKMRVEHQGPNRFTMAFSEAMKGGEKQPDWTGKFTRVKTTSDEEELIKLEHEMAAAVIKRDLATLDRLEAEDLTLGTSNGMLVTKEQTQSYLQSDAFNLTSMACEDLQVKVYGDMAVVTGMLKWVNAEGDSGCELITDTWLKRDSRWLLVAAHESTIDEATPDIDKLSPEMKKLAISVGDWSYEGEQTDPPVAGLPYGPAGQFSGTVTTRFVLGGRFLESKIDDHNPGGTTTVVSMTGYDSKAKHYVANAFLSDGSRDTSTETVSADGRTWTSQTTTTTKEGTRVLLRSTTKYAPDGNSYAGTTEASPDNGQTWKRWFSEEGKKVTK